MDASGSLSHEMRRVGLTALEVEYEVLRALPADFVLRYELLWLAVYGSSGRVADPAAMPVVAKRVTRVSSSQTETRGGARGGVHTPASHRDVVRDDRALRIKQWLDRRLRALARETRSRMRDDGVERAGVRRCTRCNQWAEAEWSYCPWDGQPTMEVN